MSAIDFVYAAQAILSFTLLHISVGGTGVDPYC